MGSLSESSASGYAINNEDLNRPEEYLANTKKQRYLCAHKKINVICNTIRLKRKTLLCGFVPGSRATH
jgi:hypothetical protein